MSYFFLRYYEIKMDDSLKKKKKKNLFMSIIFLNIYFNNVHMSFTVYAQNTDCFYINRSF